MSGRLEDKIADMAERARVMADARMDFESHMSAEFELLHRAYRAERLLREAMFEDKLEMPGGVNNGRALRAQAAALVEGE